MAVVTWNDHVELVTQGGVTYAKTHEEFTVSATSEIADIPTQTLLHGSIVLDISTGKMSVWDGENWVEQ